MYYENNTIFETVLEAVGTQAECTIILVLFHTYLEAILHIRHPLPRTEIAMALQPVHLCQFEPVASVSTFDDLTGIDIAQGIKAVRVPNQNNSDGMSTKNGQKSQPHNALKQ